MSLNFLWNSSDKKEIVIREFQWHISWTYICCFRDARFFVSLSSFSNLNFRREAFLLAANISHVKPKSRTYYATFQRSSLAGMINRHLTLIFDARCFSDSKSLWNWKVLHELSGKTKVAQASGMGCQSVHAWHRIISADLLFDRFATLFMHEPTSLAKRKLFASTFFRVGKQRCRHFRVIV